MKKPLHVPAEALEAVTPVVLAARIKKSSKYYGQGAAERPADDGFPVFIKSDPMGYVVQGGPGGQYRLADVELWALRGTQWILIKA
ncbi:MAG: conserved hypothetical bacteriophage protein [Ramlibacter sp.]|jgi:hypothetical protein|nr:conserved hypothetical bacteriophage protein [Ramlibacter sp.]